MAYRNVTTPFYSPKIAYKNSIGVLFSYVYHTNQISQFKSFVEASETKELMRFTPYMRDVQYWHATVEDMKNIDMLADMYQWGSNIDKSEPLNVSGIIDSIFNQLCEANILLPNRYSGVNEKYENNQLVLRTIRNFSTYRAYWKDMNNPAINIKLQKPKQVDIDMDEFDDTDEFSDIDELFKELDKRR